MLSVYSKHLTNVFGDYFWNCCVKYAKHWRRILMNCWDWLNCPKTAELVSKTSAPSLQKTVWANEIVNILIIRVEIINRTSLFFVHQIIKSKYETLDILFLLSFYWWTYFFSERKFVIIGRDKENYLVFCCLCYVFTYFAKYFYSKLVRHFMKHLYLKHQTLDCQLNF